MSEQSFFHNALGNFTFEVASGGAIRHLTDLGYTVKQIYERLDFPTPMERIQSQVWERLLETGVILTDEPGSIRRETADYVREYDRYGKASFRRVARSSAAPTVVNWQEHNILCPSRPDPDALSRLRSFLVKLIGKNGEDNSYAACPFGPFAGRDPEACQALLGMLDTDQREYVEGLLWEAAPPSRPVYHRLNPRMLEIVLRLYSRDSWQGDCCFTGTRERVHFHHQ